MTISCGGLCSLVRPVFGPVLPKLLLGRLPMREAFLGFLSAVVAGGLWLVDAAQSEFGLSVVSGIVSGILAAGSWAGLLYAYNWHSERRIERTLRKQFFPRTYSHNLQGWGLVVENSTGTEITVRKLTLMGISSSGGYEETVDFQPVPDFSTKAVTVTDGCWVVMPPFTSATFNAPTSQEIRNWSRMGQVRGLTVIIEYRTLVGTHKLVRICPPFESADQRSVATNFTRILFGELSAGESSSQPT